MISEAWKINGRFFQIRYEEDALDEIQYARRALMIGGAALQARTYQADNVLLKMEYASRMERFQ